MAKLADDILDTSRIVGYRRPKNNLNKICVLGSSKHF